MSQALRPLCSPQTLSPALSLTGQLCSVGLGELSMEAGACGDLGNVTEHRDCVPLFCTQALGLSVPTQDCGQAHSPCTPSTCREGSSRGWQ